MAASARDRDERDLDAAGADAQVAGPKAPALERGHVLRPQGVEHLVLEQAAGERLAEPVELALPARRQAVDDEALHLHVDQADGVVARLETQALADEQRPGESGLDRAAAVGPERHLDADPVGL